MDYVRVVHALLVALVVLLDAAGLCLDLVEAVVVLDYVVTVVALVAFLEELDTELALALLGVLVLLDVAETVHLEEVRHQDVESRLVVHLHSMGNQEGLAPVRS